MLKDHACEMDEALRGTPAIGLGEVQEGHVLVNIVLVLGALLWGISQVGRGAAVDVGLQQLPSSHLQPPWTHALMRLHNCLHLRMYLHWAKSTNLSFDLGSVLRSICQPSDRI